MDEKKSRNGAIAWMASHPVAANLLMIIALIGGLIALVDVRKEVYPDYEHDEIRISVSYPGAGPKEIETGIILPIEEALGGVDGIKRYTSVAKEGSATVTVEARQGYDLWLLQTDIQNAVNRIRTFPVDAEKPKVSMRSYERQTLALILYAPIDRIRLYKEAKRFKRELLAHKEISKVDIYGATKLQFTIEVDERKLRKYRLSIKDVADAISSESLDLPAGSLKTRGTQILVRLAQRSESTKEFESIPILTTATGHRVFLSDIAKVYESFENDDYFALYDGKPAIRMAVRNPQEISPIKILEVVRQEVDKFNENAPKQMRLLIVSNQASLFKERVNLLLKNSLLGLLIVLVLLSLFLEVRLAFWVMMGIPISFLGAMALFPVLDVSISMVSLFAFIIALGIVVDDAIIVGENIYRYKERGLSALDAAIEGAKQMAVPVTFAILTNIVAFLPIYFIPGTTGKIFQVIPVVVITIFIVSWFESLFILPSHLAGIEGRSKKGVFTPVSTLQERFNRKFRAWVHLKFAPVLALSLKYRYPVLLIAMALLIVTVSYAASGRMGMQPFPRTPSNYIQATLKMPFGTSSEVTESLAKELTDAAFEVQERLGLKGYIKGVYARIGREGAHEATVRVYIPPASEREEILPARTFAAEWRKQTKSITGVKLLKISAFAAGPGHGSAISLQISHPDLAILKKVSETVAEALRLYPRVYDISDGFEDGKKAIDFQLKPEAYAMGFNAKSVAKEVRNALHGALAQRVLVDGSEYKVIVRLPKEERSRLTTLYDLKLLTKEKKEVSLKDIADFTYRYTNTQIIRVDGKRVVTVEAQIRPRSRSIEIINDLKSDLLPRLKERYKGLEYSFEGAQSEIRESFSTLKRSFIFALFAIFVLLAIAFGNYLHPIVVMTSIPFGIIGAIFGHLLMGYNLSIVSLLGIVALCGIVVNDALILIDTANKKRKRFPKMALERVIKDAATERFRPILLTTVTTFGGLVPMIFETSKQAKFLIPMAISLGFGILFATFVTLFIVPMLYMSVESIKKRVKS